MEIVTHDPAPGSDFVLRVDLAAHGHPGMAEQVWAAQIDEHRFTLRSIPFFAIGVAPGDIVVTGPGHVIDGVEARGGRHVLRLALATDDEDVALEDRFHEDVHAGLRALDLRHEWMSVGYVAVEIDAPTPGAGLAGLLEDIGRRYPVMSEVSSLLEAD
jgi:hypothetical protein